MRNFLYLFWKFLNMFFLLDFFNILLEVVCRQAICDVLKSPGFSYIFLQKQSSMRHRRYKQDVMDCYYHGWVVIKIELIFFIIYISIICTYGNIDGRIMDAFALKKILLLANCLFLLVGLF